MAIGDSLEKLMTARRGARAAPAAAEWIAQREEIFAPVGRRLRALVGSVDSRFIKSRLTRERAVIRIGNGDIDAGWEIVPNAAHNIDPEAPRLKITETRDFMCDERSTAVLYFDDDDGLIEYLERRIREHTTRYPQSA